MSISATNLHSQVASAHDAWEDNPFRPMSQKDVPEHKGDRTWNADFTDRRTRVKTELRLPDHALKLGSGLRGGIGNETT